MQDTQTKKRDVLLLLKRHRELLIHVAHHNPLAEHLVQLKTLNWLMAHYYWLDICGDVHR